MVDQILIPGFTFNRAGHLNLACKKFCKNNLKNKSACFAIGSFQSFQES